MSDDHAGPSPGLATLRSREFWELNDRGSNFDYLTDEQKAQLPRFFGWFPELATTGPRERLPTLPPDARPPEKTGSTAG